ncbi:ParH-like protein [Streptomyces jumonjinensis]|uniref:ParH-like protein n=2 Tax=Streptomyces jumonjinensis TaxID=1945 RepID=A0A646KQB1_STRJU|nr:ParH-like protein [Streptomyces jumonjinensis]
MWQRNRRAAQTMELPRPFSAEALVEALAERRGRPIEILTAPLSAPAPCGLLVAADRADYIVCTADTTALHRQHILPHEVAHLLCGHDRIAPSEAASVPLLLPGFSAEFVRRVLGRTVYSQPQEQEQEAELLASLILRRALREDASGSGGVPPCERAGSLIGVRTAVPE